MDTKIILLDDCTPDFPDELKKHFSAWLEDLGDYDSDRLHPDIWFDCDYLKVEGESHNCVTAHIGNTIYVVVDNYDDFMDKDKAQAIIAAYFNDTPDINKSVSRTWEYFRSIPDGFAYRGGYGYTYSIAEYKPVTKQIIQ